MFNISIWCEISKSKLINNLEIIKSTTNKKIISVVKGDAYGLGISGVSDIIDETTDMFGVSSLAEANKIDTKKDILIMTPVCDIPDKPKSNHIYTIDSIYDLVKFNSKENYRVHIYVDTGMNRLGFKVEDIDDFIDNINKNHKNISIEGMYTHLHKATDILCSKQQIDVLRKLYEKYKNDIDNFHCLNSRGISNKELREYADFTNIARAGNALYGYDGSNIGLNKVFQVKARVIKKYMIKEDGQIGYGAKSSARKGTVVGVIPCGTIDKIGYIRKTATNIIKDCLKVIRDSVKKTTYIYYKGKPVYELCAPNMNCTLVDITKLSQKEDIILDLNISSIQLNSDVEKKYI